VCEAARSPNRSKNRSIGVGGTAVGGFFGTLGRRGRGARSSQEFCTELVCCCLRSWSSPSSSSSFFSPLVLCPSVLTFSLSIWLISRGSSALETKNSKSFAKNIFVLFTLDDALVVDLFLACVNECLELWSRASSLYICSSLSLSLSLSRLLDGYRFCLFLFLASEFAHFELMTPI
jgi:hypothetical protein